MVQTRTQRVSSERDEAGMRTAQDIRQEELAAAAASPPVAGTSHTELMSTPPPSSAGKRRQKALQQQMSSSIVKRSSSNSSNRASSSSVQQAKRLRFAPDPPREHLFEFASPPARRMASSSRTSSAAAATMHDSVVRLEFMIRDDNSPPPKEIGDKERCKYLSWVAQDAIKELREMHGVETTETDVDVLKRMLQLAQTLRRRSEIRRAGFKTIPHEMALKDIQHELKQRRVAWKDLTHYRAAEALEHALLKEDAEGLVGEGYQFGRRFVSAADIIAFHQPSDREMRAMLLQRGVPQAEIPKKKLGKFEVLRKGLELEEEEKVRMLVSNELQRELERRNIETEPERTPFLTLFYSNKWTSNYDDVDNTCMEDTECNSGCVIV